MAGVTATSRRIEVKPLRSATAASWIALGALLARDLVVLRKHLVEFVLRVLIQPFLLVFVFLYIFPEIGQAVGGGGGGHAAAAAGAAGAAGAVSFATVLVPGVVGISVMFQGIQ